MEKQKVFQVIYRFADVIDCIRAENEEKARKIANETFNQNATPKDNTYCHEIELEEMFKDGDA